MPTMPSYIPTGDVSYNKPQYAMSSPNRNMIFPGVPQSLPQLTAPAPLRLAAAARSRGAVALELVAGRVWALPKPQRPVAAAAVLARVHALRVRDHDHTRRARTYCDRGPREPLRYPPTRSPSARMSRYATSHSTGRKDPQAGHSRPGSSHQQPDASIRLRRPQP